MYILIYLFIYLFYVSVFIYIYIYTHIAPSRASRDPPSQKRGRARASGGGRDNA